jgi:hypothetical protein
MSTINRVRNAIARTDIDNANKDRGLPHTQSRAHETTVKRNAADAAIQTVNAFVAGTPVSWVTGPLTIAWGGLKVAGGFMEAIGGGFMGDARSGDANIRSGLKSIVAGAAAMIPVVGTLVNGTLAVKDGIDAVNTALPGGRD